MEHDDRSRRVGRLRLPTAILLDLLCLKHAAVRGASMSHERLGDVELLIEMPELEPVAEGDLIPEIHAVYTATADGLAVVVGLKKDTLSAIGREYAIDFGAGAAPAKDALP